MVREPWRGTTVARRLHDHLVSGRHEQRVTLLVEQTHPKVRRRYEEWGYTWLGSIRPDVPHAPVLDAMLLAADRVVRVRDGGIIDDEPQ